jgi:hypothetical protein
MTLPLFRSIGDFIEVTQISGGPRYIRKDDIYMVGGTLHRVLIYIKGRSDYETICFANLENQEQVIREFLQEISRRPLDVEINNKKNNIQVSLEHFTESLNTAPRKKRDDTCNTIIMFVVLWLITLAVISFEKNFKVLGLSY